MSELVYEFCSGEIKVDMTFVVQGYFNMLFDDRRSSGAPGGVFVKDTDINRFKLIKLKAACTGLAELKAEAESLRAMAVDLETVLRAIDGERRELNGLKHKSQVYIDRLSNLDSLVQVRDAFQSDSAVEFKKLNRLSSEWQSRMEKVVGLYCIEYLLVDISETFALPNSVASRQRLTFLRGKLSAVYESIKQEFKLDFKVLRDLVGCKWSRENFEYGHILTAQVFDDVEILSADD